MAGEEAGEIGRVVKADRIGNFRDRKIGIDEQASRFQQGAFIDHGGRRHARDMGAGLAQRRFADAEREGMGGNRIPFPKALFDAFAQAGHEPGLPAAAGGTSIAGGRMAKRLNQQAEKQRFHRAALAGA